MDGAWHWFFPRFYGLLHLLDPAIGAWWRRFGLGNTVQLVVPGRRTGVPRSVFLGLLTVGGRRYLGHPDGSCPWTRNLEAAGSGELLGHGAGPIQVRAVLLPDGQEREGVVRATFRQHPFPGNVIYWLARRHVRSTGRYYRIESDGSDPDGASA